MEDPHKPDPAALESGIVQLALLLSEMRPTAADRVRIEQRVALALRGVEVMPDTRPCGGSAR
jgi:hypothetical protein